MKTCIFYYDGFAEFEIAFCCLQFKAGDITAVGLEKRLYVSEEGQRLAADAALEELDPETVDLFIVPGGTPDAVIADGRLGAFLRRLAAAGKTAAGICGGAVVLAASGLLDGKRCTGNWTGIGPEDPDRPRFAKAEILPDDVVVDGNVVTAKGVAYLEFALELGRKMGLYASDAEYESDLSTFKNLKA
jgi:4-methyl-5(b-hydroxyethyl)-thiazole monophosphate biosynthesis